MSARSRPSASLSPGAVCQSVDLVEAQWERAARGLVGRTYPWGEEPPTLERANYDYQYDSSTRRILSVVSRSLNKACRSAWRPTTKYP